MSDDGLPDPIDPPAATDDVGWVSVSPGLDLQRRVAELERRVWWLYAIAVANVAAWWVVAPLVRILWR